MSTSTTSKIKIQAALRHLYKYGSDALKPTRIIEDLPTKRQRWSKPLVSKRVANTLRKKSIRNGTFGTYDALTGVGWDKNWDIVVDNNTNINSSSITSSSNDENIEGRSILPEQSIHKNELNQDQLPWMNIRPFKETKRERTREARAKKIEDMLSVADEKILKYRLDQKAKKPIPGVETTIRKLNKIKK